jgi:NADP-reducing hydrogenase subunit HndB
MAKLKIEDLKKIKDRVERTFNIREGKYRVKVTVHMGTCGISAGARTIMDTFLKEVEAKGLTDIILTSSGCAGLCSQEPMATVEIRDAAPVKYIKLDGEKARKIFNEHVVNGNIVAEYALAQGSERLH